MDDSTIAGCVKRLRAGDEQGAAMLVRLYEPAIRRAVRLHLSDQRLRRTFDSMDICQSVLASFFVRAAAGQYDLDKPELLVRLLTTMARNKLASEARRQNRLCRDARRTGGDAAALEAIPSTEPSPSRILTGKEQLALVLGRLDERTRQLAELRAVGEPWSAIAGRLGGTPESLRMQLARAIDRASRELGLGQEGI